ncbi:hypothetical protein ACP70R_001442 [Stipagrostis hirtigluma subsp. patula]
MPMRDKDKSNLVRAYTRYASFPTPALYMVTFTARRREAELVTPARPTPRELKHLSDIDSQGYLRRYSTLVEFFRGGDDDGQPPGRDPVTAIRSALAEALVHFYPFAGRLRELPPDGRLVAECTAEGVVFVVADADVSLAELDEPLRPPYHGKLLCDLVGDSNMILGKPLCFFQDMSDLMKREFDVLAPNGSNYLAWSLDAEILLASNDLLRTIKPNDDKDKSTPAEQAMALHILRHHLSTTLKNEYMTKRNPKVLWDSLHERFNLRFQDSKTIEDYNTALYGITTRMKLCGLKLEDKDLIEKTLSTFHPNLTYISRQYKKDNYKKYVDLSNAMQQDQGEDETIMQNHLSRPTGTVATLEENATSFKNKKDIKGKGSQKDSNGMAPKANNFKKKEWKSKKKTPQGPKYGEQDQECYRCGMRGHWSRICKTPKHIVEMYQNFKAS